jgi:hypothetical protein
MTTWVKGSNVQLSYCARTYRVHEHRRTRIARQRSSSGSAVRPVGQFIHKLRFIRCCTSLSDRVTRTYSDPGAVAKAETVSDVCCSGDVFI